MSFEFPLDQVIPIYRRVKEESSGQTFRVMDQAYDPNYQSPIKSDVGSVYYFSSWPDWRQNPLVHNVNRSSGVLAPTLTFTGNPIYTGEKDVFEPLFYREPKEVRNQLWKFGPIDFGKGGLQFTV